MTPTPANTPPRRFSRPRPRLRKAAKWGGLIFSILLVAAWVASVWWSTLGVLPFRTIVEVRRGRIAVYRDSLPGLPLDIGFRVFSRQTASFKWSFSVDADGEVWIPLWFPALSAAAISLVAWRREAAQRRRFLLNHCSACGYDRAGLPAPDTLCPECGAVAPAAK